MCRRSCRRNKVNRLRKYGLFWWSLTNGAETLPKAFEFCLVRNEERLAVIVVDNGATDHMALVAGKYAGKWYGSVLMTELSNAWGKYFRILNCDDRLDTAALEEMP